MGGREGRLYLLDTTGDKFEEITVSICFNPHFTLNSLDYCYKLLKNILVCSVANLIGSLAGYFKTVNSVKADTSLRCMYVATCTINYHLANSPLLSNLV